MITEKMVEEKVKWICADDCYNGVFYIGQSVQNEDTVVYIYLDKYGYYNIFPSIEEFCNYMANEPCIRICVKDDLDSRDDLGEGVDVLDAYMYENIDNIEPLFDVEYD